MQLNATINFEVANMFKMFINLLVWCNINVLDLYTTYYFGVAFMEPPHGQEIEDMSDGENSPFQSLKDMSQDTDKIRLHLHGRLSMLA